VLSAFQLNKAPVSHAKNPFMEKKDSYMKPELSEKYNMQAATPSFMSLSIHPPIHPSIHQQQFKKLLLRTRH
jgi:hypothetical protein